MRFDPIVEAGKPSSWDSRSIWMRPLLPVVSPVPTGGQSPEEAFLREVGTVFPVARRNDPSEAARRFLAEMNGLRDAALRRPNGRR